MKIILSPAKKMVTDTDSIAPVGMPEFLDKTTEILSWMKSLKKEKLKAIWKCNDKIAGQNFEDGQFAYIQKHLRILSAFYGVLKPLDGVKPYRLEMQAKVTIGDTKNLYDYWKDQLYQAVIDDSRVIINLASKEYSKCIEKYLTPDDKYITVTFCELSKGKLVTKGTYAKMARGEMVRYMAENSIEDPAGIQKFNRLGYRFREDLSSETEYIFEIRLPQSHCL